MKKQYPRYENVDSGFFGKCIMNGAQGVNGSKFDIKIIEPSKSYGGDCVVEIIKKSNN